MLKVNGKNIVKLIRNEKEITTLLRNEVTIFSNNGLITFAIKHGSGLMDFTIGYGENIIWTLSDGTTLLNIENPSVTLDAGISYVSCTNWDDVSLSDGNTNANYLGNLADLPPSIFSVNLPYCSNIEGNLGDLKSIKSLFSIVSSKKITGNLLDLPPIESYLRMSYCVLIEGDLSNLTSTSNYVSLAGCELVFGIFSPSTTISQIYLQGTAMTSNDTNQTLINLKNITTVTRGGTLQIKANRTSASDVAFDYLSANGWTITEV